MKIKFVIVALALAPVVASVGQIPECYQYPHIESSNYRSPETIDNQQQRVEMLLLQLEALRRLSAREAENVSGITANVASAPKNLSNPEREVVCIMTHYDVYPQCLTKNTYNKLEKLPMNREQLLSPFNKEPIIQTLNLADSWEYWKAKGISAQEFDEKIHQGDPLLDDEESFTVSKAIAEQFLRSRGFTEEEVSQILSQLAPSGDYLQVNELLDRANNE